MKAIIPAAGKGTRLLPHTYATPKPLVHVAGKPILGHIIDNLIKYKVDSIGFILGDNGEQIIDYARSEYSLNIDSVYQSQLNGLGYAIYLYLKDDKYKHEPVLIVLGDTIFDADLSLVLNSQYSSLAVRQVSDPRRFGIVETEDGFVKRLVEKPENPQSDLAIVGIYFIRNTNLLLTCLEKLINEDIKTKNEYQLTDALQLMLENGEKMTTFTVDGWYDCGTYDALLHTNRSLLDKNGKMNYSMEGNIIVPPVSIAESAKIENSIIGPYVSIADNATITKSIIEDAIIEEQATIRNALIKESIIGGNAIFEGQFNRLNIGDYSRIMYVGSVISG